MDYQLKVSASRKFLIAEVNVNMSSRLGNIIAGEAVAFGKKKYLKRILYDLRKVRNKEDVHLKYKFVNSDMPKPGNGYFEKSAILVSPDDASHNTIVSFMKSCGFNVMKFEDEQKAVQWLETQ
ncbi:MAG: hypothetical protein GXX85_14610 [Ignavibacteria bacterium]|nr:hypothetical protein [Ignavibacteria bacterium]